MSKRILAQAKAADDSKRLVDLLCERVLRPDFDTGSLNGKFPSGEALAGKYVYQPSVNPADIAMLRLIKPEEWDAANLMLMTWQEELELSAGREDPLDKILLENQRFPTIEVVIDMLGIETADMYKLGLEDIENNHMAFSKFPEERVGNGWTRSSCERAVSLVINVIAPNLGNFTGMAKSYIEHMNTLRTVSIERRRMTNSTDKKNAAKALGIWFPMQEDKDKWFLDPRTKSMAMEFETCVTDAIAKMRTARSILQYIPRRKFTAATVEDLKNNIERIKQYCKTH